MYFDGFLKLEAGDTGVLFISPRGEQLKYVFQILFEVSNNEAEYEYFYMGCATPPSTYQIIQPPTWRLRLPVERLWWLRKISGHPSSTSSENSSYHQMLIQKAFKQQPSCAEAKDSFWLGISFTSDLPLEYSGSVSPSKKAEVSWWNSWQILWKPCSVKNSGREGLQIRIFLANSLDRCRRPRSVMHKMSILRQAKHTSQLTTWSRSLHHGRSPVGVWTWSEL